MALDLSQLTQQIAGFVPAYQRDRQRQEVEARRLRALLQSPGDRWPQHQRARAAFLESPSTQVLAPSAPQNYRVVATDGSQVPIDRHQGLDCYVINIGLVQLEYGQYPEAKLGSVASLRSSQANEDEEDNGDADVLPNGLQTSLELDRAATELAELRRLVEHAPSDRFTLALLDNSLILWSQLMNVQQSADYRYIRSYIAELEAFATLAQRRPLALAGYLSSPSSPWVADLLAIETTNGDGADKLSPSGILDRDLFAHLEQGERSARLARRALMLEIPDFPPESQVEFFYLRADEEIARVEIPLWVSNNPDLLAMTHATILDQCRRNQGNPAYPVALMEAHEQAVVTEADRQAFWRLLGDQLVAGGMEGATSAKSRTKRTPWT